MATPAAASSFPVFVRRLLLVAGCAVALASVDIAAEPAAPLNSATRHRVVVSTDIGGTDPDDNQSMAHLLVYADAFDLEGLVSSPYGPGRKQSILEAIEAYEKDYPALKTHSATYPTSSYLRSITKQGALDGYGDAGFDVPTEGSKWIVRCARQADPRPLWVLVWGGIDDLAQALHDAPDILPKLRVYFIGGPNKKWSANAYNYIERNFPNLWIIENNSTYTGWFLGGNQQDPWSNQTFVSQHIAGRGALGRYFASYLNGTMKMGDTPSVVYLLGKNPEDPTQENWGGRFVRAWHRPRYEFSRLTTAADRVEQYAIVEITLPPGHGATAVHDVQLLIENQTLPGFIDDAGALRFRLSPKLAQDWTYTLRSDVPGLNGQRGAFTSYLASPELARSPDPRTPHWWTDDPDPSLQEKNQQGAKSVNRWREAFLRDFAQRMERCASPRE